MSTYEVEEAQSLYDEVDEEGYKNIVRSRLDRDDFVVGDTGEGYADDGREDWHTERRPQYESESEDELPARGKAGRSSAQGSWRMLAHILQPNARERRNAKGRKRSTTA